MEEEFDRQVDNLLRKGYHTAAGMDEDAFRKRLEPLRDRAGELAGLGREAPDGHIPFVLVIEGDLVASEKAMSLVERQGKEGFTILDGADLGRFQAIEGLVLPGGDAYLLVDVDTGEETLNVTPDEALKRIQAAGRSPLTIDEGIAVVTHFPDALRKNHCFSLPGSRCGDRRVTALWISEGRPKLGWCWAGNPHTWLGSASCAGRVGT